MTGLPLPILRVPPPPWMTEAKIAAVRMRLEAMLESVRFPAARWQLVAAADHHGADHVTLQALRELWAATYPDAAGVIDEIAQNSSLGGTGRAVPSG
jgi:hypothetical protein